MQKIPYLHDYASHARDDVLIQKALNPLSARYAEVRALRAFVMVAEELHFGRAAERLALSQSSLTQMIKHLEQQVGHQLFRRNNRRVALSEHGTRLIEAARAIVSRADAFLRLAMQPDSRTGEEVLRIGYQGLSLVREVRNFYHEVVRANAAAAIILRELMTTQQVEALQQGTLDLGIINKPAGRPPLRMHRLAVQDCVVALGEDHPLCRHDRISMSKLSTTPLCLPLRNGAPGFHDSVTAACAKAGFSPIVGHETHTFWNAAGLAAMGMAVAVLPESIGTIPLPGLTYRRFRDRSPVLEVFAAWDPAHVSPALKRALDQLGPAV